VGDGPRRPDSRALTKRSWTMGREIEQDVAHATAPKNAASGKPSTGTTMHGPGSRSAFRRRSRLPTRSRGRQRHEACDSPKQVVLQSFACLHGSMKTIERRENDERGLDGWKSPNGRICAEMVQREPPGRESSVLCFAEHGVHNHAGKDWATRSAGPPWDRLCWRGAREYSKRRARPA
jgi:hypothetical protein